jgi:hypothetical protein
VRTLLRTIVLVLGAGGAFATHARADDGLADALDQTMESLRARTVLRPVPDVLLRRDPAVSVERLGAYLDDGDERVRHHAAALILEVARPSDRDDLRREAARRLMTAVADPSALVRRVAREGPALFDERAFTPEHRERIARLLDAESDTALVRLAGAAGARGATGRLRELAGRGGPGAAAARPFAEPAWSARLALVRMGEDEPDECVRLVGASDDLVLGATRLWRDLAYTRRTAALEHVAGWLESDARLPGIAAGRGLAAAQYAADALLDACPGAPFEKRHPGGYAEAELRTLAEWIEEETR